MGARKPSSIPLDMPLTISQAEREAPDVEDGLKPITSFSIIPNGFSKISKDYKWFYS